LTVRNWLIGYYIVEYEQHGEDRAQYGEKLLNRLSEKLGRKGLDARRLREFRQVYLAYPQLAEEVDKYLKNNVNPTLTTNNSKWRMLSAIFEGEVGGVQIWRMPSAKLESWQTPAEKLFQRLSASHLIMLSGISDTLKRAFYEQEAIKGCWTVKELDRQISSLCYERMGYSKNKAALQKHLADKNNPITAADIIRNPLSLEFLGLQQQDVFTETKLETAILNHLQQFLLELGTGFCFEARQKRVLIDNDYFKADLVFYHRILKCHVIVDLKIDRFRHEYASQLNLYLNYFKHEIMQPGDNPPVGLLLCTDYGETTVKYATEGLSQNLFVSKYKLQLPSEEEIKKFLTDNFAQIESL
jgi:predicted nuclease of restriction endonuclease-like (RecB) superfamily